VNDTTPPPVKGRRKKKGNLTLRRARAFTRRNIVGVQTTSGKIWDLVFISAVFVGITALALESVPSVADKYLDELRLIEQIVGAMFVLEYVVRIWTACFKLRYIFSFWGLIDLVAILPFLFQGFGLAYLRLLRVLRIFAILKVTHYTQASAVLLQSLVQSRSKILVFLLAVCVLVSIIGFTMHAVEPETFPTVPDAIWWTVVTITTVGYGDMVPTSPLGKVIAGVAMVTAFGIIAVPTGIVVAEYGTQHRKQQSNRPCPRCRRPDHEETANYCATCGERLAEPP
jgi:voltage-gated potassium channel